MSVWMIIIGIATIVFSLVIIAVILLQQSRRSGIGAISGGADTFLSKNKARTVDAILGRWTKFIAIGFFVLAIAADIIVVVAAK